MLFRSSSVPPATGNRSALFLPGEDAAIAGVDRTPISVHPATTPRRVELIVFPATVGVLCIVTVGSFRVYGTTFHVEHRARHAESGEVLPERSDEQLHR